MHVCGRLTFPITFCVSNHTITVTHAITNNRTITSNTKWTKRFLALIFGIAQCWVVLLRVVHWRTCERLLLASRSWTCRTPTPETSQASCNHPQEWTRQLLRLHTVDTLHPLSPNIHPCPKAHLPTFFPRPISATSRRPCNKKLNTSSVRFAASAQLSA